MLQLFANSSYSDVTDEKNLRDVLRANGTNAEESLDESQTILMNEMYRSMDELVERFRKVQTDLREDIRSLAVEELEEAQVSLVVSIILLVAVSLLAPIILLFNRNVAVMGQVRIIYLTTT